MHKNLYIYNFLFIFFIAASFLMIISAASLYIVGYSLSISEFSLIIFDIILCFLFNLFIISVFINIYRL